MNAFDLSILAVTWLMMLAVGLSIDGQSFHSLRPRSLLLAATLVCHLAVLPVLALMCARGLSFSPSLTAALILIAASPVGDIVGFYTVVGRGTVPLALALNAASCLLAPLTMALAFATLPAFGAVNLPLQPPGWPLVARVLLVALLPVALGIAARHHWPVGSRRVLQPVSRTAGFAILGVLAWALVRQRESLALIWPVAIPAILAFLALAAGLGGAWARLWRLSPRDTLPVVLTFPVRNVGVAAALATLLGQSESLALIGLYFLLEVPLFLGAVAWVGRRAPLTPPLPARASIND